MFKNPKIFLEKYQIKVLWHKEYRRKWLLKVQHQSQNTEAILSKNQMKSSAQDQKLMTRQMEKLRALSSQWVTPQQQRLGMQDHTSHPWSQQLISSVWFSPKPKFQAACASWTHRQCSSEDCRAPSKACSVQEGNRKNLPSPRGVSSKCRVPREGAQLLLPSGSAWDAENKDQQLSVLGLNMRAKVTEWRPSQRGVSPHISELLTWELGRGGRIVQFPAFSGGLYLFVTAANN